MPKPRPKIVSVAFDQDEVPTLQRICEQEDRSMNYILRRAFFEYVERREASQDKAG